LKKVVESINVTIDEQIFEEEDEKEVEEEDENEENPTEAEEKVQKVSPKTPSK
jgi:hypothetical protein